MLSKIIITKVLKLYTGYAFTLSFMFQSQWVLLMGALALAGVVVLKKVRKVS